jgi:hypothetical protein
MSRQSVDVTNELTITWDEDDKGNFSNIYISGESYDKSHPSTIVRMEMSDLVTNFFERYKELSNALDASILEEQKHGHS